MQNDYSGNFLPYFIQIRIQFAGSSWKYTRLVFSGHSNGQPEVMQVTDYYPFGFVVAKRKSSFSGIMNQQNYFADGVLSNKYLYNGKELQDDELAGNSLGWYKALQKEL